jgi:parallel beta-helix repeat protein
MRTRTALFALLLAAALPAPALAATITVSPGDSIQKAVNKAKQGDNVRVEPGTYQEDAHKCPAEAGTCAVHIRTGIRLIGLSTPGHPVVLKAKGDEHQGIEAALKGDEKCLTDPTLQIRNLVIRGFTIQGFKGDGVFVRCAVDWRISKVRAIRNNEYGIFPVFSGKGRVDHSFASGANDTGIYVGQSHDVQVDHNTAINNVSGFELENTTRSVAEFNVGHDNTAGLLTFALPNLVVKVNRNNQIRHNDFRHNNRDNTCLHQRDEVCNVPPGSGIVMVATDKNLVTSNTVKGNRTVGIATVSYCIVANPPCNPDIDPNPDDNHIVDNTATGNGKHPAHPYEGFAADLVWDGTGHGNCWGGNTFNKSFPEELPAC